MDGLMRVFIYTKTDNNTTPISASIFLKQYVIKTASVIVLIQYAQII